MRARVPTPKRRPLPPRSPSGSDGPVPSLAAVDLPWLTARLRLELPTARHVPEVLAALNDVAVAKWLLKTPYPYRRTDAVAFVRRAARYPQGHERLALWIVERSTDRLVGGIGLHHFSPEHRHAELGYWVGRPFWGRGYATEAGSALVALAFGPLGLHRLEAATFGGNHRSARVLEKLGFHLEGVRPHAFYRMGRWVDDVLYGLVRRPGGRSSRPRRPSGDTPRAARV